MRLAKVLCAFVAAMLPVATAGAEPVDRAALIALGASVLKVEAIGADGRFQLGSSVVVGDGTVVTACHVTRHAARVSVVKGGMRWNALAQHSDIGHDLCLLQVPGLTGVRSAQLANSAALKEGQPLFALGYTGGAGLQISSGEVLALHEWDAGRVIRSSNGFTSGASGGGLFNAAGELVGVLTFRLRGGEAHYFSAPADWLRTSLADATRFAALRPLEGRAFWEQPPTRQPLFLRAASLEQARDWQRLSELAEAWHRERPSDAEAPYMRAVAAEELGRDDEALRALRQCLDIDPGYMRGWQRLARLQRRLGRDDDVRSALQRLNHLDARLARVLRLELDGTAR